MATGLGKPALRSPMLLLAVWLTMVRMALTGLTRLLSRLLVAIVVMSVVQPARRGKGGIGGETFHCGGRI